MNILESSENLEGLNKEREDVKKNQMEILELKICNNWQFKTHWMGLTAK